MDKALRESEQRLERTKEDEARMAAKVAALEKATEGNGIYEAIVATFRVVSR